MQDPFIGTVLDGRYEILARIGEGGMGVVYKARQVSIDRVIAIKVLNAQMAADPQWVQRFSNEARACSRLQHPNTIKMFDFGQTQDGRFFMTMEFLDGQVLRQAIQNSAPMQPARVMRILVQCCASLAEAHSIGIIHRDIKPDNVFLMNMPGSPDFVKLLDFSVAKLLAESGGGMKTQAGVVFGTPQYMSPEQGRGMPLDARSDLYALGVLGYEMLTGNVPFNDDNPMAVLQMHLRSPVPPLPGGLPPSVANVVTKALDKDPGRRFQSAGEMMQVCQQVLTELNASAAGAPQQGPPMGGGPQKTMMAPGVGAMPGLPGMPPPAQPGHGMGGPPPPAANPYAAPPGAGGAQKTMMAPGLGSPGMAPPPAGPPPAAAPQPGQRGYVPASAEQKTMIAQQSPFAPGGALHGVNPAGPGATAAAMAQMGQPMGQPGQQQRPMGQPGMPPGMGQPPGMGMGQPPGAPPGMGYPGMQPPGGQPGMQPPGMGMGMGQPGMQPPGMGMGNPMGQQGMPGMPGMGQQGMPGGMGQQGGGPPKTMMLQNTEGIVSVAARGAGAIPASHPPGGMQQQAVAPISSLVPEPPSGASGAFWAISLILGAAAGAIAYAVVRVL